MEKVRFLSPVKSTRWTEILYFPAWSLDGIDNACALGAVHEPVALSTYSIVNYFNSTSLLILNFGNHVD